ncbi:MAG: aminopeptidase P family protein [Prevotellaceae bacterium]|nr:aminopeptidase P family protein [Prevotellaceae bacterium]MDY6199307.1 aminopeptidase P family protein [Prevotella sp.]
MGDISNRLAEIRVELDRESLGAYIFTSTDPHNGEYVPDHWKCREYVSGFDGSAGTVVVAGLDAALWTDSRYFLAAERQLRFSGIQLMKERIAGTPTIPEWLSQRLMVSGKTEVGIDGWTNSYAFVQELKQEMRSHGGITVRTNYNPLDYVWNDRPARPSSKVVLHDVAYAGENIYRKLKRLRSFLAEHSLQAILISSLDDIAWLLNLRASDVHCNPVFVSYLVVAHHDAALYIDASRLSEQAATYLNRNNITVLPYEDVSHAFEHLDPFDKVLMDPNETPYTLYAKTPCRKADIPSPLPMMKAVKNEVEIKGFDNAMMRDGVAMVQFLRWLRPAVEAGGQTEISVSDKLRELRASQDLFVDLSFDTIAGYQEHGAIVHYEATPATDMPLRPEGLLLLDSGAHYLDGTTDITRTIALGPVTDEQRLVYTLVLKGNIQLAMLKFPKGASGTQLDALARKDMWSYGYNYLHGTGHGVGSYLNVHEGPHQIRMEYRPAPLLEGMTVTDEPGIYVSGRFGVRIENTMIIEKYMTTDFGEFLQMRPLTLCPIDLAPVNIDMLTAEEKAWLNNYHADVYAKLSPLLDDDHRQWLAEATKSIS